MSQCESITLEETLVKRTVFIFFSIVVNRKAEGRLRMIFCVP